MTKAALTELKNSIELAMNNLESMIANKDKQIKSHTGDASFLMQPIQQKNENEIQLNMYREFMGRLNWLEKQDN
jgi:hypothetical protein